MNIIVFKTPKELGEAAADQAAVELNLAIERNNHARLLLSTGESQFETLDALKTKNIEWSKVELFHLDEYIGLPESDKASFRKYLKERFTDHIHLKKVYFVNGENPSETIKLLTEEIRKVPIDVGLIGIGENGHIAFNDPPADFDTREAFIQVNLDDECKMQQVREGWFEKLEDVPAQAISMTVHQIMQCKTIISAVPNKVKAKAIKAAIENDLTNLVPATILKSHPNITLFLDLQSSSLLKESASFNETWL